MSATTSQETGSSAPRLTSVALRYAEALFELGKEQNSLETLESDLSGLGGLITGSDDFQNLLKSPVYGAEEKAAAVNALAEKAGLSELARNFVALIGKNNRLFALDGVIAGFRKALADHRGEVSAEATSAAPLNDDQQRRLRGEIEGIVGKAVNLNLKTDPELLGGLVVKVGSTMIDSSLRTKLNRLKTKMKEA